MTLKKILIIQTASIGDVILATPVIEALHIRFPEAEIDFLLKKGIEGLFSEHPYLHEIMVWTKAKNKYRNFFSLLKKIRKTKYDLVVDIHRFTTSGLLTAFSNGKQTVGFNKNPFSFLFSKKINHNIGDGKNNVHETSRNLELVKSFTGIGSLSPKLYLSPFDIQNVEKYKTFAYLCIAPASLWFTKQFPEHKWIEFINSVSSGYTVYLLGSQSDQPLCNRIIDVTNSKRVISLAGKLNFLESAALMKDALMNYVNDSAPLHLASSVNARVTVIFCSTLPEFGFGPMSYDSVVIETAEKLNCRPCGLHGHANCPEKHFACAESIDIESLLQRLP